jgi:hypothetical protein
MAALFGGEGGLGKDGGIGIRTSDIILDEAIRKCDIFIKYFRVDHVENERIPIFFSETDGGSDETLGVYVNLNIPTIVQDGPM